MCVVSMVMDHQRHAWSRRKPRVFRDDLDEMWGPRPISPQEIEDFRQLLERAREYDKRHNEPDCELDEKRIALKKIAAELGVEIAFL